MTVSVVALQIAPASRLSMQVVERVETTTGHGIVGDRYENSRRRHISIQSLEEIAEAEAELGRPLDPVQTRRNITLSTGRFTRKPNSVLTVGTTTLRVVRDAAPCKLLEDSFGPGANRALRKRAGIICEVLEGGPIRIGDVVVGRDIFA